MQAFVFVGRLSVALFLVATQAYLLMTRGLESGAVTILFQQSALQLLAALVAPMRLRVPVAIAAAWASMLLGAFLAFTWATVIMPLLLLLSALNGEPGYLIELLSLTIYLLVPVGIVFVAAFIDSALES